jgi:hypothetical protein
MGRILVFAFLVFGVSSAYADNWLYSSCGPANSGPGFRNCHMSLYVPGQEPRWTGVTGDVAISALNCENMSDPKDSLCSGRAVSCKIWKQADHSVVCNQVVPGYTDSSVCAGVAKCKNAVGACNVGWCFEYSQGGWEVAQ